MKTTGDTFSPSALTDETRILHPVSLQLPVNSTYIILDATFSSENAFCQTIFSYMAHLLTCYYFDKQRLKPAFEACDMRPALSTPSPEGQQHGRTFTEIHP
ncbi:MAG: hypothetical protein JW863_08850 [Chitinispirillaceae bacterium]|nr:hypothetical protein [Chitinispirillaceae bacterium]